MIFRLLKNLKLEGFEKSFKMTQHKLLDNRLLLGVSTKELTPEKIFDICRQMNIPEKYQKSIQQNLPEANIFLLGFEQNENRCIYKAYLEFWDKIKREISTKVNKTEPALLYLGFKWDFRNNTKCTIDEYVCYPLLSVTDILTRLSDMYRDHHDATSFATIKNIIHHATTRSSNNAFVYLEVNEKNNPRISFDINLYKAQLTLKDIYPLLIPPCIHYQISAEHFDRMYNRIDTERLGHLSGGLDRAGKDFLTIYYEVSTQ